MTKKRKALIVAAALSGIFILVCALLAGRENNRPYSTSAFAMGSFVQQTLYGPHKEQAGQEAYAAVVEMENHISWRREHSAVYILNHAGGSGPVPLDGDTRAILEAALAVSRESGGAFDVTIAPISWLWDFDENPHLPDAGSIREALALVGYEKLTLSDRGADLPEGMAVDLGAAGKGAACDKAVGVYRQAGVRAGVVAVGGSVGLYGEKPGGGLWQVSVRDPWGEGSIGVLALGEGFVSTSGSYEKVFEEGGRVYHHLLDPDTGYPAESGLVSVTVCCDSGALSDCLATACFVLGYEKSLPVLEAFGAGAVFIDENKEITCTPGLAEAFTPVV